MKYPVYILPANKQLPLMGVAPDAPKFIIILVESSQDLWDSALFFCFDHVCALVTALALPTFDEILFKCQTTRDWTRPMSREAQAMFRVMTFQQDMATTSASHLVG